MERGLHAGMQKTSTMSQGRRVMVTHAPMLFAFGIPQALCTGTIQMQWLAWKPAGYSELKHAAAGSTQSVAPPSSNFSGLLQVVITAFKPTKDMHDTLLGAPQVLAAADQIALHHITLADLCH